MGELCMPRILWTVVALAAIVATGGQSDAAFISTTDRGWYDNTGFHIPDNTNYITGFIPADPDFPDDSPAATYRSFYTFNLVGQTLQYLSAALVVYNPGAATDFGPGYSSPDATETITLFGVTTPVASLTNGTGGVAAFNDLGTGPVYGSAVMSAADNGQFVTITLNATGLAALNAARGGSFAVGASVTSLSGQQTAEEFVFGFSGVSSNPQYGATFLNVVPVPAPAGVVLGLIGAGSFGIGGLGRRRLVGKPAVI